MNNLPPKTWEAPHTHLTEMLHNPWYSRLAKLYNLMQRESTLFFREHRVAAALLPITTGAISSPMGLGSDSVPVSVELFGQHVFLSDSMQFLLELILRLCPEQKGVWYVMPSFRGEMPDAQHLNEFIHLESEIVGGLEDVIDIVNSLRCHLSRALLTEMADIIKDIAGTLQHLEQVARGDVPQRIAYSEAVGLLDNITEATLAHPAGFIDITRFGEQILIKKFEGAVWLTNHPLLRAPFYQKEDAESQSALCADLLFGVGETVGAGARHSTADEVIGSLAKRQISVEPYEWYIEMKRQAPLATAGFGMGVERFLAWVCNVSDIRYMQLVIRQRGVTALP